MKTTTLKKSEFQKAWHLLDATDISVGRLASRVSLILKGKNKPQYSPNLPVGDGVIIINTDKVKFSGNKDKTYKVLLNKQNEACMQTAKIKILR